MFLVLQGILLRDHAAIGMSENEYLVQSQVLPQGFRIVCVLLQIIGLDRCLAAAAAAAVIDIDQLHRVRESG